MPELAHKKTTDIDSLRESSWGASNGIICANGPFWLDATVVLQLVQIITLLFQWTLKIEMSRYNSKLCFKHQAEQDWREKSGWIQLNISVQNLNLAGASWIFQDIRVEPVNSKIFFCDQVELCQVLCNISYISYLVHCCDISVALVIDQCPMKTLNSVILVSSLHIETVCLLPCIWVHPVATKAYRCLSWKTVTTSFALSHHCLITLRVFSRMHLFRILPTPQSRSWYDQEKCTYARSSKYYTERRGLPSEPIWWNHTTCF